MGDIIHDWSVILGEVDTGNLAVAAGNQTGMKHTIALDFKHPLGLDASLSFGDD